MCSASKGTLKTGFTTSRWEALAAAQPKPPILQKEGAWAKCERSPRLLKLIILVTLETEIRRIIIQSQPRQKISEILSQQTAGHVAHACHLSYVDSMNRIAVQDGLGIK
jgi:hypothetical protein